MLFDQDITLNEKLQSDALSIELMDEKARFSLRIKPKDLASFKKVSGLALPVKIGKSKRSKDQSLFCLGPDEWLLSVQPKNTDKVRAVLEKMAKDFTYSHVDVSHRNIGFIISGTQAVNTVNIGCPLDLSLDNFPIGKVTRTVFENAPIMLLRSGETEFELECWRSFAPYICGFFDRFVSDL